ncbi:MAG: hypothetical protein V4772_12215 [Pseudomonadota bacterium]
MTPTPLLRRRLKHALFSQLLALCCSLAAPTAFAASVNTQWEFEIAVQPGAPTPDAASKAIVGAARLFGSVGVGSGQDRGTIDKNGYTIESRIVGSALISTIFDNLDIVRKSKGRFVNGIALTMQYSDRRGRSQELTTATNLAAKRYEFAKGGKPTGTTALTVAASDLASAPYAFLGKPAPLKPTFLAFNDGKSIRQSTLQPYPESVKVNGKVINAVRLAGNTTAGPLELWIRAEDGYPIRLRVGLGAAYGATLDQRAKDIPAGLILF